MGRLAAFLSMALGVGAADAACLPTTKAAILSLTGKYEEVSLAHRVLSGGKAVVVLYGSGSGSW